MSCVFSYITYTMRTFDLIHHITYHRRDINATDWTRQTAVKAERELRKKLKSCFLQRMKHGEFKDQLPDKEELVVWINLSNTQRKVSNNIIILQNHWDKCESNIIPSIIIRLSKDV